MDEVEDMGNIIKSEFLKLKRYYVVKAGIIMTVLSPLLTLFYSTANDGQTWTFDYFMQQVMISNCTLFFPIIITLIAGYIITREYTDDTMKNISTIPISYRQLLSGKLLVLLLLTICFSFIGCVIALAINIIAGFSGVHFGNLFNLFIRVIGANIGIYISVLPIILEMSRNVQSGNTQNLKSMVIQRSFPKWSVAERRKTAAASDQAAVCACAHSRYFAGGSPSGLRV